MATLSTYTQDTIPSSDISRDQDLPPNKISAYYSLVFPTFTYYLQTLNVTIGRRCIPSSSASSSDNPQVDVDLGPLKSVSRLHAKIEYEEEEERFVLVVIGRNGAWVDGVWSGSGSKVPLGERSQIQIASRTFHFVLPPPPAPEDSPSPSSQSSGNRARSPSVDIVDVTSLSPPSSIPSCSPPPAVVQAAPPKIPPLPESSLPNSNAISKFKSNSKKRRKPDAPLQPLPPPAVMPPKPQFTYAQLCYRGIKALGGKASLQDICQWIRETYEWFKYCEKDWESSVRHNLSSNPGFKKLLRTKEEKGKGALWLIDEAYEHTFEEQDARKQAAVALANAGGKDIKPTGKRGKTVIPLEPALKRSVRGDLKGAPLPPPLTSAPLALKTNSSLPAAGSHNTSSSVVKLEPPTVPVLPPSVLSENTSHPPMVTSSTVPPNSESSGSAPSAISSFPAIPASVRLPIIVGPVPSQTSQIATHSPSKPIVLHDNTLILNPEIFSHLTPEHLRDLEALGAQKALEILQSYIVRYYKEKLKAEGGRGRGRGRPRRGRGASGRGSTPAGSSSRADTPNSGPFTTAPLAPRPAKSLPAQRGGSPDASTLTPEAGAVGLLPASMDPPPSPIVVIDDDPSSEQEPAAKRRRLEGAVDDMLH